MKKIVIGFSFLVLLNINFVKSENAVSIGNKDLKFVSLDSLILMQKSKEGQKLVGEVQAEVGKFQKEAQTAQKELIDFQETVSKQAKVLSREALAEKGEKLAQMKKNAERELGDKEEALKLKLQKKQYTLREKQLTIANEIFEKEDWGMMIDRNTPGLLFVKSAIDKTDIILKKVDEEYEKEMAKNIVEKEENKSSLSSKKVRNI